MAGRVVLMKEENLYRGKDIMEHDTKTDRDLLIQAVNDICWLKKIMGNHLQHHSKLLYWVLGIMGSLIIAMALLIITR